MDLEPQAGSYELTIPERRARKSQDRQRTAFADKLKLGIGSDIDQVVADAT